jgi:hypothetical protein
MQLNLSKNFSDCQFSDNIADFYSKATSEEVKAGLVWYKLANEESKQIQLNSSLNLAQIAGIIAALSPRNKWLRNLVDCENLVKMINSHGLGYAVDNYKSATFGRNTAKALVIAGLDNPTDSQVLDILGGNKVKSFYTNILEPENCQFVTIDGHAIGVALGERLVGSSVNTKDYLLVSGAYIELAEKLCLIPNQLQAVTWLVYKRTYKIN